MAMEVNSMVLEGSGVVNGSINLHGDGSVTIDCNVEESENPGNVLLEDLDSYWEDINDRLTISRMVSDSVIKGMVNAIEQEAAEKIVEKELELVRLKESLHLYHVGAEESEPFGSVFVKHESGSVKHRLYSSLSDALSDYDRIGESMGSLKTVAKEQLKNLRKEIDCIKGSCSVRRIGSASEIFGMGGNGILPDKVSDIKWMDVDKTLDSLRTTIDTICKRVDNMVYLSKASLCQCQQEKEFEGEIEDMVIMNCFRSLKEDYEKKLWYLSSQLYDNESFNWLKKIKEISSLREELNVISKSLSVPEIGHIASHGSMEIGEEWDTNKRNDHVHCKISGNPVSLSTSLSEGNGKHDESVIAMPENLDFNQLKHMTKEDLVNYFKTELTKMKRNHEHKVTEMTEGYFSLKREYLREKGSSLPIKKDKEFDMLRKKIPEVLLKLDDILVENEKSLTFCMNAEGLCSLKDRLESLLLENHQLRSLLTDNKKEVKRLSLQVSDTAKLMLQHSLAEANLQCALDDAHIEASISEDVYKCILGEAVDSMKSVSEKSDLEYKLMQEIYEILFNEAAHNAKPSSKCEFEDSDLGSVIMQDVCTVIFGEALKEAEVKLNDLIQKYSNETELRVSVENEAVDKERALRLEVAEKERLISESSKEFDDVNGKLKGKLIKALEQIEQYNVEVQEQEKKLELAMKELRDTNEDKRMLINVIEQKQLAESLVEAKDREHLKQMQNFFTQRLSETVADFECRVMEDIQRCHSRLDSLSSQSICLIQKANVIKRTGLIYKQKLERRCSDLQKAEAEVDLLGDEVDTLLSLLEKIYIALDHYSPILQHYPGIIEILKLVRRELSGESTKPV